MARYMPPEGYTYDEGSGLYYSQVVVKNEQGQMNQLVVWFDDETGEYTQKMYPISQVYPDNSGAAPKRKSPVWLWVLLGVSALLVVGFFGYKFFGSFFTRSEGNPTVEEKTGGLKIVKNIEGDGEDNTGSSKDAQDPAADPSEKEETGSRTDGVSGGNDSQSSGQDIDEEVKPRETEEAGDDSRSEKTTETPQESVYDSLLDEPAGYNPDDALKNGSPMSGCKYAGGYWCYSIDVIDDLAPYLYLESDGSCSLKTFETEGPAIKYDGWYTYKIETPEFESWGETCYIYMHFPTEKGEKTATAVYDQETGILVFETQGFGKMYDGNYTQALFEKFY